MQKMTAIAAMTMTLFASQMTMASAMAPQELDIDQVISVDVDTDDYRSCGEIRTATMVYEDSQGQRHTMKYQVIGNDCGD